MGKAIFNIQAVRRYGAIIRKSLLTMLGFAVLQSGCTTTPAAEFTNDLFEQFEVVTGSIKHQTVIPGFFLGGPIADLAVLSIDENSVRLLSIYTFDNRTWVKKLDAALGPHVKFVDVANIDGVDRLITYKNNRLNWFDPDSDMERELVRIATNYNARLRYANVEPLGPVDEGEIPHVE
ncbi:MAG: hypothetical protein OEQ74_12555, partial [Gammaproteobacteria bacterium]|nr:hypothetical protein [Gammaproteobacteria bacterium]